MILRPTTLSNESNKSYSPFGAFDNVFGLTTVTKSKGGCLDLLRAADNFCISKGAEVGFFSVAKVTGNLNMLQNFLEAQNRREKERQSEIRARILEKRDLRKNNEENFEDYYRSRRSFKEAIEELSDVVFLEFGFWFDYSFDGYVHDLRLFFESVIREKQYSKQIFVLKQQKVLLRLLLKWFLLNRRDFFRKVNGFIFKSLDDCDSPILVSF